MDAADKMRQESLAQDLQLLFSGILDEPLPEQLMTVVTRLQVFAAAESRSAPLSRGNSLAGSSGPSDNAR